MGGVFCLILYDMKGESFVIPFQVISGVKSLYKCVLNSFKKDTIMTQNSVSRQLQRIYCTENQLLNNHKHSEM